MRLSNAQAPKRAFAAMGANMETRTKKFIERAMRTGQPRLGCFFRE
jgi:hypothetical protein